jgi:hypothetical protein
MDPIGLITKVVLSAADKVPGIGKPIKHGPITPKTAYRVSPKTHSIRHVLPTAPGSIMFSVLPE